MYQRTAQIEEQLALIADAVRREDHSAVADLSFELGAMAQQAQIEDATFVALGYAVAS